MRRMDLSSRFLDRNSIEYVWDGLGKAISHRSYPPSTPQELKVTLWEKWVLLPQILIGTFINSMAVRCDACIVACSQ
ncbi:hypothetical protein TNCV_3761461 [Trichonephila clavipes]|nr:hypothetical protein TNCV_3761461 [Trichonephila clavipes]